MSSHPLQFHLTCLSCDHHVAKMAMQLKVGGYDYQFVKKKLEKFTCSICTKVLRDPHLTACCGQNFCESCLEKWRKSDRGITCPHCREKHFKHILDKKLKREIDELKIKCPNKSHGCKSQLKLGSLDEHMKSTTGCAYATVECPYKCMAFDSAKVHTCMRIQLDQHIQEDCDERPSKCEHCGLEGTYSFVKWEHYTNDCPGRTLDCPNECGMRGIKGSDMDEHRSTCPFESIACPYFKAGCRTWWRRCDLETHVDSNVKHHLEIATNAFKEARKREKVASKYIGALLEEVKRDSDYYVALENARSIFDKSYHLRTLNDECETIATLDELTKHSAPTFLTPPFYINEGYKMRLKFTVTQTPENRYTLETKLELLQGEFDEKLTWPYNDKRFSLHIHLPFVDEDCGADYNSTQPQHTTPSLYDGLSLCSECIISPIDRVEDDSEDDDDEVCRVVYTTLDEISEEDAERTVREKVLHLVVLLDEHRHIKRRKTSDD